MIKYIINNHAINCATPVPQFLLLENQERGEISYDGGTEGRFPLHTEWKSLERLHKQGLKCSNRS
jgi:hypothetical protein